MFSPTDDYQDLPEYEVAKKVWYDIFNNDTLTYNNFEDYFIDVFVNCEKWMRQYHLMPLVPPEPSSFVQMQHSNLWLKES